MEASPGYASEQKANQMFVGGRSCFFDLVLSEIPHLRAYARLMTNDAAGADREVENTLKHVISGMDRMSSRATLKVQLMTILRGFLISSEHSSKDHFISRFAANEERNPYCREKQLSLPSTIIQIDYKDREALVLSADPGLSPQEAAQICGCDVREFKARRCRGLARAAELLSPRYQALPSEKISSRC